jgi:SSS family solute:Na+ symporter
MGRKGYDPTLTEGGFGVEYMVYVAVSFGVVSCAIWPTAVARALAARSPRVVKRQFMWGGVSFLIRFLIPYFWGVCAFVFIHQVGGRLEAAFFPAESGVEAVSNLYAMPIFLGRILPVGLVGLITAAMLAAFMSTHDSYLLCWSSVLTQDVIAPLAKERLSSRQRVVLARVLIVVIGLYVLGWGLIYRGSLDIFDYMGVTGAIYAAGAFALVVGGLYWRRASSTGAVLALLCGASGVLGLGPVQELLGIEITPQRVCLGSFALTTLAMILGSLFFPDPAETSESETGESSAARKEGG